MLLEEPDVRAHALLEPLELEEVDLVDRLQRGVAGVRVLHERAQLRRAEREHPAARVVEDRDLARPEEALGDDYRPEGFFPVGRYE